MPHTIAAIATGGDLSAIGIIRLSGDDTPEIMDRVFFPASGRKMSEYADRSLVFGELRDEAGQALDICLGTISRAPNSYTGENTAELQLHGSPTVLREALRLLFSCGAIQASAGEFTKRAFLNGRMDLTQAEAVIDLIHAETPEVAKIAALQLGGAVLRKAEAVYSRLTDIMSHFHAVLDYPDEEIDAFELLNYTQEFKDAEDTLSKLLNSFDRGRVLREGITAAIVGKPNVGKSSILNALLGYDRAIVTNVPGTTRDTIEERLRLGHVLLRLIDTAGIRKTVDIVENIGVERSLRAIEEAELVLAVFDGSEPLSHEDEAVMLAAARKPHSIAVINKADLPLRLEESGITTNFAHTITISAACEQGLDELTELICTMFPRPESRAMGEMLTNERQAAAVRRALEALAAGREAMGSGITPDAVLTEVENAMAALGELTGRTIREDITARIFERFCVGK